MTGEANTFGVTLTRSYDAGTEHLDSITTTYGPSFGYHFDAANRVDGMTDHAGTLAFTYDSAGQLKNDGVKGYDYDAAGNRLNSSPVRNRQTTDGTWTYAYDSEGNMTGKTRIAGGESWTYVHDFKNQLVEADQTAGTTSKKLVYTRDAYGQVVEVVYSQQQGGGAWQTLSDNQFAYVGGRLVLESDSGYWEGNLTGDGSTDTYARFSTNSGDVQWLVQDRQGSVRDTVSGDGTTLLDQIDYDAYGNVVAETAPSLRGTFGYTGLPQDSAVTGLVFAANREYNPQTGQWLENDPIGFGGGTNNVSEYVGNDPANGTDPSGLEPPGSLWGNSGIDPYGTSGSNFDGPIDSLFSMIDLAFSSPKTALGSVGRGALYSGYINGGAAIEGVTGIGTTLTGGAVDTTLNCLSVEDRQMLAAQLTSNASAVLAGGTMAKGVQGLLKSGSVTAQYLGLAGASDMAAAGILGAGENAIEIAQDPFNARAGAYAGLGLMALGGLKGRSDLRAGRDPLGFPSVDKMAKSWIFGHTKSATSEISSLGNLQGKSKIQIEKLLISEGFDKTSAANGGTIWIKAGNDGNSAAIRIDPPMIRTKPKGFADEVYHVHKEIVPSFRVTNGNYSPKYAATLDDAGSPTTDARKTHIPGGH